jgi:hypothetical protein
MGDLLLLLSLQIQMARWLLLRRQEDSYLMYT